MYCDGTDGVSRVTLPGPHRASVKEVSREASALGMRAEMNSSRC